MSIKFDWLIRDCEDSGLTKLAKKIRNMRDDLPCDCLECVEELGLAEVRENLVKHKVHKDVLDSLDRQRWDE